jgi:CRP/FNR family transcriptional regulator, cyclic AMP receptor protein
LRTATVVALEEAHTLSLTRAQLDELRRQHPRVDRFITEMLAVYVPGFRSCVDRLVRGFAV